MKEKYNLKNIDLVILAGGRGTRIRNLLGKYPKPMVKFNKKHFLQYILNNVSKYNFNRIIILCGYRSNIFFKKLHKKTINFTKIFCLKEKKLLGTGGALTNLKSLNVKDFVLVNGDSLLDIDIKLLVNSLEKKKIGINALISNKKQRSKKLNNLILKKNIISIGKNSSLMNGGIYFFNKKIFNYIKKKNLSLENDLLPKFIKKRMINGKIFKNFFIDIGSNYYFNAAKSELKKQYEKPAIFLDRDGVINHDYGYVHQYQNFKFRSGVLKGLKYLIKNNYNIFIVTNQAGIGKKLFTEENFFKLHKKIKEKLEKLNIYFNDVQYSPFHPKAKIKKFRKESVMRKPGNQMIKNIMLNWDVNKKKSFMIGDKETDKLAAKKSKLKYYYAEKNFYDQVRLIVNSY